MTFRDFQEVKLPLLIWLTSRFVVFLSWVVSSLFIPGLGFKESWLRWDGAWYFSIVADGYSSTPPTGASNIAFFPGLPMAGKLVSLLPGISQFAGTVSASAFFGFTAVALFYLFAKNILLNEENVVATTFLFALTPGSLVFSMIYSEGLFISLSLVSLTFLTQKKFLVATVAASIAGLVRPSGFIVILIVMSFIVINVWKLKQWKYLYTVFVAPIGMVSYGIYLHFHVGSVSAYFDAQRLGWGEAFSWTARIEDVYFLFSWIANGFGAADWNRVIPGLFLLLGILGFVGCIRIKLAKEWLFYTAGIFATSFFSQTLGLRPRFFMTSFPLFLGLTYFVKTSTQRYIAIVLSASALSIYSILVFSTLLQTP